MAKDFTYEEATAPAAPATGSFSYEEATGEAPKPASKLRRAADTALALGRGIVAVPETAVGISDLITGGRTGKAVERLGVRFKDAKQVLTDFQSDEQKAADAQVQQADGFLPTLGAMVENPSTIANAVAESAPSMLAGGAVSRGLVNKGVNGITAGAVGEGVVSAGQAAEQVRQEGPTGFLTPKQAALAATSGAATGVINRASGKLADKLGIGDVNTAMATGKLGGSTERGIAQRTAYGVINEGVLQELPQSMQEQAMQNLALDKPVGEGVAQAGAAGMLVGNLTGAAFGAVSREPQAPAIGVDAPDVGGIIGGGVGAIPGGQQSPPQIANETGSATPGDTVSVPMGGIAQTGATTNTPPSASPTNAAPTVTGGQSANGESVTNVLPTRPNNIPNSLEAETGVSQQLGLSERPGEGAAVLGSPGPGVDGSSDVGGLAHNVAPVTSPNATTTPPRSKARAMGIDPTAGPLSAGAAIAVDTGADVVTQTQEVEKQKAEAAAKEKAKPGADGKKPEPEAPAPVQPAPADPTAPITGPFTKAIHGAANVTPTPAPAVPPQGPATPQGVGAQPDAPAAPGVGADQGTTGAGAVPAAVPEPGNPALTPPPTQEIPNATQESIDPETGEITQSGPQGAGGDSGQRPADALDPGADAKGPQPATDQPAAPAAASTPPEGKPAAPTEPVDLGAHTAATSPHNDRPEPTDAQKLANNYKQGHLVMNGLGISIENPEGSTRSGTDADGKPWTSTMTAHYGSVKRTVGSDGDAQDVYIKPGTPLDYAGPVFVVDQIDPKTGKHDEFKSMVGYKSPMEARKAYMSNYAAGWKGLKSVKAMPWDEFKAWVKGQPAATQATAPAQSADSVSATSRKSLDTKETAVPPSSPEAKDTAATVQRDITAPASAQTESARPTGQPPSESAGDAGQQTQRPAPASGDSRLPTPQPGQDGKTPQTLSTTAAPAHQRLADTGQSAPGTPEVGIRPSPDGTPATTKSNTLRVGTMPTNAEPVTIKDGVIYIGKYEALNFDTGEPVRIAPDANPMQIRKALADNKALGAHQKVFGGVAPVETPAITPDVKTAPVEATAAPAKPAAKPTGSKNLRSAAYERNPLMTFLAQHGLFHDKDKPRSQKAEFSPDKQIMVMGYGPVFKKTGLMPDLLVARAIEDGYLPQDGTESQLVDLIRRAIGGEKIVPMYAEGAAETEMQKRMQAIDDLRELDDNEVADLDSDIFAESNTSTEDAMRALGFTDQEIHDATTQGPRAPQEGRQGRGEPDETQAPAAPSGAQAGPPAPAEPEGPGEGLTAPTRADVLRQQEQAGNAQALDDRAQVDREAGAQTLTAQTAPEQRRDTSGDMFAMEKAQAEASAGDPLVNLREQLRSVEREILLAAPSGMAVGGGDIETAMRSRAVPKALKDRRNDIKARMEEMRRAIDAAAGPSLFDQPAEPDSPPATPATQTATILDAANVTGSERLSILKDVKSGALTPDEVQAAFPGVEAPKQRLTDAGEELIRNRRGKLKGLAWDDVSAMNDTLKVAQVIKSNVWPRPDYAKMVEDGAPAWKAAALKAVYDKLATAPVTRTAPTDDDLRAYIETMNQVRETLMAELDRVERDGTGDKLWASLEKANVFGKVFPVPTDARPVFGSPSAFDRVSAQGKENNRRALLIGGNAAVQALQFNYKMTSKVKDLLADGFPKKQEAWEKSYEVRQTETRDNDVPEGERTGEPQQRFYVYEKGSRWRLAKGVQDGGYATQEQAEAFARTLTAKKRDLLPPSRGLDLADVSRTGPDWRKGQNITSDQLMEHFGFRGVNLGEYVKAKQDVAQAHLNHAFDAFNDLADLLGVPPKAMSLNGTLGVAIGAQGSGKALAHFVPGVNEINITRDSGAGALAHEFGHAVDHYFATQHGRAASMAKRPYLSAVVESVNDAGGVRPEVMGAMRIVMKAINSRPMTEAEAKKYMADQRALNERRMDRWVAEFKSNRGADPAALAAVAEKLKRGDVGEVRDDDVESNLAEFMRAAGLKPGNSLAAHAFTAAYRLRDLADEARFLASHIPQMETNYSKASAALDVKKTGDGYWGTPWEKFARAFETFVMDALADRQRESLYLSGLVDSKGWQSWSDATGKSIPYPTGDERLVMQQAFQKLVDTIQTREDDAGNVAMYSKSRQNTAGDSGLGNAAIKPATIVEKSTREILSTENAQAVTVTGGNVDALKQIAGRFGKKIVFFRAMEGGGPENRGMGLPAGAVEPQPAGDEEGAGLPPVGANRINGFTHPGQAGTVFLNVDSDNHLAYIVGHELGHTLKIDDPALWSRMGRELQPLIRKWSHFKDNYPQALPTDWDYAEELFGDVIGQNFVDPQFWREMAQQSQSLFRRIASKAIELLNKAVRLVMGSDVTPYIEDMNRARAVVASVMAEYADGAERGRYTANTKDTRFARAKRTTGVHMDDAEAIIASIREALPTAPPIIALESIAQAPADLRKFIKDAGAQDDFEAAYHNGKIYVLPSNVRSTARLQFLLAHHEIRHHGFGAMLGPRKNAVMFAIHATNANVRAAAAEQVRKGYATSKVLATEEALADMPVAELVKLNGWDKIVAAIREWLRGAAMRLRRAGLGNVADAIDAKEWTDKDVAALIARAEGVSRGGSARYASEGTVFGQNEGVATNKDVVGNNQGGRSADDISPGAQPSWIKPNGPQLLPKSLEEYADSPDELLDLITDILGDDGEGFVKKGELVAIGLRSVPSTNELGKDPRNSTQTGVGGERDSFKKYKLDGASTIGITGDYAYAGYPQLIEKLRLALRVMPGYVKLGSGYVSVVVGVNSKSNRAGVALDDFEQIISKPKVVAYIKSSLPNGYSPNESPAPDSGGALFARGGASNEGRFGPGGGIRSPLREAMDRLAAQRAEKEAQKFTSITWSQASVMGGREVIVATKDGKRAAFRVDGDGTIDPHTMTGSKEILAGKTLDTLLGQNIAAQILSERLGSLTGADLGAGSQDTMFARGGLSGVTDTLNTTTKTASNTAAHYRSLGLQALGRRQIVELYRKELPQLQTYSDLMAQMDADKNEAGAGADQIAQDWGKLKDEQQLAEAMHDATLAQMDPEKPLQRGDDPLTYDRLRAQFEALSPEAQKVYRDARDTYRAHHENVRTAIRDRIERSDMKGPRKAELLKQMDDEFYKAIKGVYFPLARFGDYVVIVRDDTGKAVSVNRAETLNEAESLQASLRKAYPDMTVGKVLKSKEFNAGRDAVGRGFMQQLYEVLGKKEMDEKQRADLEDMLGQLYLSALPDLSWAKHGIHRKGTAGFSQDARRAFAQNTFHGARYLAKVRYSDLLENELSDMQKQVDALNESEGFDQPAAQDVINEMTKRHDSAMNPNGNALSTALTSLGFVFHLGLSPASAMVNLSQTALVAYPIMGAKWGFTKASTALLKASQQAAANRNDISTALSPDEKRAYDEAVRSGVIDVTMAHDLAGISQGEDAKVSWKLRPVMRWASFLFHHAEKFNRQVTFVASYRLAREAGTAPAQAYEQAVKATYDGHFDYGATNRPRVMQGNAIKVILLFKSYAQNMVYTLTRQAYLAMKGQNPYERAQARKALGGLLAMHAAAAGVLGLPMVSTLLAAASMLGGDDDEPWDAEVALRNMLADALGDQAADVLARGLSRLTPWDISGRVGLDKLILPDIQEGLEGQRLGESAMAAALGPVAGIGISLLRGMQEVSQGNWARGLEAMAPSLARGPLKALRYGTEGAIDKTGKPIVEDVGGFGIAGQALGFSPSDVRLATEAKSAVHQADARLAKRRATLMRHYAMAMIAGDEEGAADAREDILAFNERNPQRRINPLQMARSVATRRKQIAESQGGVYLPKTHRDAMEAGQFGMP